MPITESLATDTGIPGDLITADPTLTGSAAPNVLLTLTEDGQVLGTATADGSGIWSFRPVGLADGAHTIVVGNDLNVAIQGTGFFQIQLPDGEIAYTRDGAFTLSATGQVVTADGNVVEPGITIPNGALAVTIDDTGTVQALLDGQSTPVQLGTIQLAAFANEAGLVPLGGALFQESANSGVPVTGSPGSPGFGTISQAETASLSFTLDTTAPQSANHLAHDTGVSQTDAVTSDATLTGLAAPNETLVFTEGTSILGTTTADAGGIWTFVPPNLADGTHVIAAGDSQDLNIAVQGNGYFQIQLSSGEIAYTRDGSFSLSPTGQLVTADGNVVQPGITIPNDALAVTIDDTGTVRALLDGQPTPVQLGSIQLAIFANQAGLTPLGGNLFQASPASGAPEVGSPGLFGIGAVMQLGMSDVNFTLATPIMATRTWIGGNSGDPNNWDQPLNWSDGLVPVAGDDVIIDATTSEPILSADTAALLSITIDPGANLTIGAFALNAATATNSGTIISTDPSSDGVHLESGGLLTNSGTSSAISGGHLGVLISLAPGTVTNEGTITGQYGGVGVYGAGGGGVITNSGISSAIVGGVDGVLIQDATGTVNNQGTISGTSSIGVYLAAGGTVTNSGATSAIIGAVDGVLIRGAAGTVDNQGTVGGPSSIGVYLSAGGTVTNSGSVYGYDGVAVLGGAGTVINQGAITGTNSRGLGVFLNAGGTVTNLGLASVISSGRFGVYISGAAGTVSNQGSIAGANSVGAYLTSGGLVTNSGASSAISGAIDGVLIRAATGTVTNEGTITGTSLAGVDLASGAVTNLGGSSIISSDLYGVLIRYAAGTVTNQGTISATNNYGVYLGFGGLVTNSGSPAAITGGIGGVFIAGAAGTVTNAGTIEGVGTAGTGVIFSDLTGAFDNTVINSGDIIGDSGTAVQFGAGSDLLEVLPGASFTGLVDGGIGTNTLELAAGTGAGTLTGLGTTVTNFNTLEFDSSAQWALSGNIAGLGGASAITGFSTTDTIDLTGFAAVSETFANNALVLTDASSAQATLNIQGPFSSSDFRISNDGSAGTDINLACYLAGTRLSTDHGEVAVEDLVIGERLVTVSGEAKPIKWIGHRSYSGRFTAGNRVVLPILIRAGALAEGVPRRDLMVSPKHAMFLDGMLIPAEHLINGVSVAQIEMMDEIAYFHIELDKHDVIHAEGALSETYVDDDNRGMFQNAHEFYALHPDKHSTPARYFAERVEDGYELEAVRRRVDVREGLRQQDEPPTPTTLRGSVDHASLDRINGWVQNVDHPEAPVCLDVFDNGVLIARALANRYRPDLKKADLGSGRHSFEVSFPTSLSPLSRHVIQVCRSLDGTPLGTPRVMEPLRITA